MSALGAVAPAAARAAFAVLLLAAAGCRGKSTRAADSAAAAGDDSLATAAAEPGAAAVDSLAAPTPAQSTPTRGQSGSARGTARDTAKAQTREPPATGSADTVRGTIRVSGSSPFAVPTIRPLAGGPALTLTGPDTAALKRISGLEVMVRGTRGERNDFRVSSFVVRAADGAPAIDGVVTRDGDALSLRTADGRLVRLGNPPAALREMTGSRVWISGPVETGPNEYGVIAR